MHVDEYLTDASGARVDRRGWAALISFGPALAIPLGCLGGGVLAALDLGPLAFLCAAFAFLGLIVTPITAWVFIFQVARSLDEAILAWYSGDPDAGLGPARRGLKRAFRGDFRTKGFHVLGLLAEARGDFEAAEALFRRAREALPAAAAPLRKARATGLIEAHRALCLLGLSRPGDAERALIASQNALGQKGGGMANAVLDDASWGLGVASLNSVLEGIEKGRSADVVVRLVQGLGQRASGDPSGALATFASLGEGLLPRERVLVDLAAADCRARSEGVHRAAPPPGADASHVAWAERVLY